MNINKTFLNKTIDLFNNKSDNSIENMREFNKKEISVLIENKDLFYKTIKYERNVFSYIHAQNPYANILSNKFMENDLEQQIINNWDKYFPEYEFVDNQVVIPQGRIDILAKDKKSKRDVIIELKYPCGKLNRQLFDYMENYNNPILVGVNSKDRYKSNRIIYKEIISNRKIENDSVEYIDKEKYYIYEKLLNILTKMMYMCENNWIYNLFLNEPIVRTQLFNIFLNDCYSINSKNYNDSLEDILINHIHLSSIAYNNSVTGVEEMNTFINADIFLYYCLVSKSCTSMNKYIFKYMNENIDSKNDKLILDNLYNNRNVTIKNIDVFKQIVGEDYNNVKIDSYCKFLNTDFFKEINELYEDKDYTTIADCLKIKLKYKCVTLNIEPKYEDVINNKVDLSINKHIYENIYSDSYITKIIFGNVDIENE